MSQVGAAAGPSPEHRRDPGLGGGDRRGLCAVLPPILADAGHEERSDDGREGFNLTAYERAIQFLSTPERTVRRSRGPFRRAAKGRR